MLCSDQDPRWRAWRGGGDPPNARPSRWMPALVEPQVRAILMPKNLRMQAKQVLEYIKSNPGCSTDTLMERLNLKQPAVSAITRGLRVKDLITAQRDEPRGIGRPQLVYTAVQS